MGRLLPETVVPVLLVVVRAGLQVVHGCRQLVS